MSVETTVPLPPVGGPTHHHRVGDRLTWLYTDDDGEQQRVVGTVTTSNTWTFHIRWDENRGEARFAHGHEPDTMRPATAADERAVLTRSTLTTVAHELVRLADTHTVWPGEIRRALRARAAEILGGTR